MAIGRNSGNVVSKLDVMEIDLFPQRIACAEFCLTELEIGSTGLMHNQVTKEM